MEMLARLLFFIVGVVNTLPVLGVQSADRLSRAYGVTIEGPDMEILLRHRAVLFAVVGVLLFAAVWKREVRALATALGLLSMLSFVGVAYLVGGFGPEVGRIVTIDLVASVLLVGAFVASRVEAQRAGPSS